MWWHWTRAQRSGKESVGAARAEPASVVEVVKTLSFEEAIDEWMLAFTVMDQPVETRDLQELVTIMRERFAQIRQMSTPGQARVHVTSRQEQHRLEEVIAHLRSAEQQRTRVHLMAEGLLLQWLVEATQGEPEQIRLRLALTMKDLARVGRSLGEEP